MATITARMDEKIKEEFLLFCDNVGITASSLFNMFAKTCIKEQKVPFEITALNFEARRCATILKETSEHYNKIKNKPWNSEEDIMQEITTDRRKKYKYATI